MICTLEARTQLIRKSTVKKTAAHHLPSIKLARSAFLHVTVARLAWEVCAWEHPAIPAITCATPARPATLDFARASHALSSVSCATMIL